MYELKEDQLETSMLCFDHHFYIKTENGTINTKQTSQKTGFNEYKHITWNANRKTY